MNPRRRVNGTALAFVLVVMGCGEPTTPRVSATEAPVMRAESVSEAARSVVPNAYDLLLQQLAFTTTVTGTASAPPTCTILRLYSPSLNFDRTTKVGNCGACIPGNPVLAVSTSGAGGAGNTAIATARCGGIDVAGPAAAADPGRGGVTLNAGAGLQVAGVPECVRSYSGTQPPSNRSFTCLFF